MSIFKVLYADSTRTVVSVGWLDRGWASVSVLKLLVEVMRKVYNIGAHVLRRSGVDGGPETIIAVVGKF